MLKSEIREVRKAESVEIRATSTPMSYSAPEVISVGKTRDLVQGKLKRERLHDIFAYGFYIAPH